MASYKEAVEWIGLNDAAGDTPEGMSYDEAYCNVSGIVSACLVADLWRRDMTEVTIDILRVRGFKKPRGFNPESVVR